METVRLAAVGDSLIEVPIYEDHFQRGKNWLAVIDIDGTVRGGISRRWAPFGKGPAVYMVGGLAPHDAVEFGADYVTSAGTRRRERWYGVVVGRTEEALELERCPDAVGAVMRSRALRGATWSRAAHLARRKAALEAELQAVTKELEDLEGSLRSEAGPVSGGRTS